MIDYHKRKIKNKNKERKCKLFIIMLKYISKYNNKMKNGKKM